MSNYSKLCIFKIVVINFAFSPSVSESGWRPGVGEPCDQAGYPQRPAVLYREEGIDILHPVM